MVNGRAHRRLTLATATAIVWDITEILFLFCHP
jgi:hypothetical protein